MIYLSIFFFFFSYRNVSQNIFLRNAFKNSWKDSCRNFCKKNQIENHEGISAGLFHQEECLMEFLEEFLKKYYGKISWRILQDFQEYSGENPEVEGILGKYLEALPEEFLKEILLDNKLQAFGGINSESKIHEKN